MNKLKKWLLTLVLFFSSIFLGLTNVSALNIVEVDSNSTIAKAFAFQPCVSSDTKIYIDTSYNHFSDYYTYTSNFTQPVSGDDYSYRVELKQNSDGSYKYVDGYMPSIRYIYENVGIYDGEVVNARVTLSDITDTYNLAVTDSVNVIDSKFDHYIYIDHGGIGFCAGRCHAQIEFLDSNNQPISNFKGNMTGTDLDSGQGVYNVTGVDTIYYKNNTIITASSTGVEANSNAANGIYDENGQFLLIVNSNIISFDWCKQKSPAANKWSEGRYISFQKAGFLRNETPSPDKSVDQEVVNITTNSKYKDITYTISQYVPYQPLGYQYTSSGTKITGADYGYTKFVLKDTLPDCLISDASLITCINDANEDCTDDFDYTLNDHLLTISAKETTMSKEEFYSHTYMFTLPASISVDELSSFTDDQGTFITNTVSLIYSQKNAGDDLYGGKASVTSEVKYAIDSFHDEGSTITDSMNNITGGDSKTFEYEAKDGYYITGLKVDDQEVEYSKLKGSYTFGNITGYHTIEVTSNPYYMITTEVVNGKITDSQYKIEKGESRVIEYQENENYYLDSIEVDSSHVDLNTFKNSYNFSDISQNHHIKVIYSPYLFIETTAINGTISGNDPVTKGNVMNASYTKIKKGEDQLVSYEANEGYYLEKIEIAEYIMDDDGNMTTSTTTFDSYEELEAIASQYSFENLQHSAHITVTYRKNPTIKITKTIEGDYNLANGTPIFIFKISGNDYTGKAHTYYRMISFKEMIQDGKLTSNSITLEENEIPAGIYTIEEVDVSRYTCKSVKNIENSTVESNKGVVNTLTNDVCHVEFINEQTNFKDYSHNDAVINHLN